MARRIFHALMAIYFAATLGAISAQAAERMMIVLDGSGSMWGQIDGEAKISIARRVLKDVLATTPQDLELGLMAYGHREEGQCADIELLVTPAQGTAADIGTAAESVTPLGKTPLSASVREAAEALAFTEQRATVLVITDGIETCNADPCALGAELAQLGVDFTAHVVGFGLSAEEGRQVACLAEETGGLYVSAEDADALADALTDRVTEVAEVLPPEEEVVEETPPELPEASLAAPDTIEIGLSFDVSWEGPGEDRDYIQLFDPAARNGEGLRINARRLVNADYENRSARFVAPVRPGVYDLRYTWGPSGIVIATRPIEVIEASVSLDAPATVDIGARFDVSWVGPGGIRDRVDIIDPSGGPGNEEERLRGARLVNGDFENRTVTMVAPAEPGFYQLQYWNGDNSAVLATREIEVLESAVLLTADAEVAMGTRFIVGWEGPGANRDVVEIFDPAARGGEGEVVGGVRLVNSDYENRQVAINAPATPGEYLLRYWNGDNSTVLATLPLTVVEMAVSLSAPDTILMGHVVAVEWVGPGATRLRRIVRSGGRGRPGQGPRVAAHHQWRLRCSYGALQRAGADRRLPVALLEWGQPRGARDTSDYRRANGGLRQRSGKRGGRGVLRSNVGWPWRQPGFAASLRSRCAGGAGARRRVGPHHQRRLRREDGSHPRAERTGELSASLLER